MLLRNASLRRLALAACLLFVGAAGIPLPARAQEWSASGVVIPLHDVTVSVSVLGTVDRVLAAEGDGVTKGQPVIQLRDELQALEATRRRLVWEDDTALEEARQRFGTLSAQLAHTRELFDRTRSVPEDELRKQELEVKLAELEVKRLDLANQQEKVDYDIAQAQLKLRTIEAPFDGSIVKLFVDVGDLCSPGQPVARIVDISKCRLVVHMDAAASRALREGMPVRVSVNGYGARAVFDAVIDYVAPVADPSSGLREIKAVFANPERQELAGLTGTLAPR